MKHRGEIVKKAIYESGMPIVKLAKSLKKDPKTIYNWFEIPDLPYEKIMEIGKIIRHDFSSDFSNLNDVAKMVEEPLESYNKKDYKEMYYSLLREQNQLLQNKLANFNVLAESIEKLASLSNKSVNNLGDDIKETLINNNKKLSECLSQISKALQK